MTKPARLGEILLRKGLIRHDQLDFLLAIQKSYEQSGRPVLLGELLVAHRALTTLQVTEALFFQEESSPESIHDFISAIRLSPS